MTPQKAAILSAHFSAIAHATEDLARVEQAVRFVIGLVSLGAVQLTRQYLKGHHGNMITTISATVSGKELSQGTIRLLSRRLSESDREFLSGDMSGCVDEEGNLYLRFDKQQAFLGIAKLYQGDPIRVKLKFAAAYGTKGLIEFCRENGLIS